MLSSKIALCGDVWCVSWTSLWPMERSFHNGNHAPLITRVDISDKHASTVPLMLSLDLGAITPQFHVVFDDWFATVSSDHSTVPDVGSMEWNKLFGDSECQHTLNNDDCELRALLNLPAVTEPACEQHTHHA